MGRPGVWTEKETDIAIAWALAHPGAKPKELGAGVAQSLREAHKSDPTITCFEATTIQNKWYNSLRHQLPSTASRTATASSSVSPSSSTASPSVPYTPSSTSKKRPSDRYEPSLFDYDSESDEEELQDLEPAKTTAPPATASSSSAASSSSPSSVLPPKRTSLPIVEPRPVYGPREEAPSQIGQPPSVFDLEDVVGEISLGFQRWYKECAAIFPYISAVQVRRRVKLAALCVVIPSTYRIALDLSRLEESFVLGVQLRHDIAFVKRLTQTWSEELVDYCNKVGLPPDLTCSSYPTPTQPMLPFTVWIPIPPSSNLDTPPYLGLATGDCGVTIFFPLRPQV